MVRPVGDLITLVNRRTGELKDVPGDDGEQAKALRHALYLSGWERVERRRCRLDFDMLACDCVQTVRGQRVVGQRHGPDGVYFLRRYLDDLDAADGVEGKTLVQINAEVANAYLAEARRSGACVGKPDCVHVQKSRPIHMDTRDYLRNLGYVQIYQNAPRRGWVSLMERHDRY